MKDILDMAAVKLEKTGFYHGLRHILTVDTDRGACGTDCIQHDFYQFVYAVSVNAVVPFQQIKLKIFTN